MTSDTGEKILNVKLKSLCMVRVFKVVYTEHSVNYF